MKKLTDERTSVYPPKRILFIILGGIIAILFFAVFLFTRNSFIAIFDLSDKGTIGDAINGITGPIIALISAGLLFYSFQAQLEANKRQLEANKAFKSQWEFDTYYKLYGEIEKAFKEDLVVTVTTTRMNRDGKIEHKAKDYRAVAYVIYTIERVPQGNDEEIYKLLTQIDSIIEDIIVLINYVIDSDVSQKRFFLHRINRFYTASLEDCFDELFQLKCDKPQFQQSYLLYELLKKKIASLRRNELKENILA